jgi:hypothetical protein
MLSNDPIKDYMRRHACGFPEALEALAAQLGPPTAHDIRRALQTLSRAGAPVELLEALEAWSADQMQQAARSTALAATGCAGLIPCIDVLIRPS